jgi:hypothetical protein
MKNNLKSHSSIISKSDRKAIREGDGISKIQKKEKILSAGVYALIIIITVALMLILFNLFINS